MFQPVPTSARLPSLPLHLVLLLYLLSSVPFPISSHQSANANKCPVPVFRSQQHWTNNHSASSARYQSVPLHFYAITQDCQFILARPDQLSMLASLRVDRSSQECHPSRVQLLWSLALARPSLLLFQRRSPRELCVLPVEMPQPIAVLGPELFSYSLRMALSRFAKCSPLLQFPPSADQKQPHQQSFSSHHRHSFAAEPDLLFPDSLYSDLLYLLGSSNSSSSVWPLLQLQMSQRGHLRPLELLSVQALVPAGRREGILLASDVPRRRLFAVWKSLSSSSRDGRQWMVHWTCPFDLLFRPTLAKVHSFPLFPPSSIAAFTNSTLTGFSVDRHIAVFTMEAQQQKGGRPGTDCELYLAKLSQQQSGGEQEERQGQQSQSQAQSPETRCVLRMPFSAKFGVISERTLRKLEQKGKLPAMGEEKERPPAADEPPAEMKSAVRNSTESAGKGGTQKTTAKTVTKATTIMTSSTSQRTRLTTKKPPQTVKGSTKTTSKVLQQKQQQSFWERKTGEGTTTTLVADIQQKEERVEREDEETGEKVIRLDRPEEGEEEAGDSAAVAVEGWSSDYEEEGEAELAMDVLPIGSGGTTDAAAAVALGAGKQQATGRARALARPPALSSYCLLLLVASCAPFPLLVRLMP